ncbi:MAG: hypothetical protein HC769_12790 [Cyanobacteria bacterium CRU_2_1]|nr:hypothetical protein [Cyanobacteria bacterium RU_5_0]NJR59635.1 hypothetical protein [Cyanobacteria bacterium CRU_2_1]
MTYRDRLNSWAVARLLPSQNWQIIHRFHRRFSRGDAARTDAEGHCRFLQQQHPDRRFIVVFDLPPEREEE